MANQKILIPLAADGLPHVGYVKIAQILKAYPVGRSTLYDWVRSGKFPRPYKIGPRTSAWKVEDVRAVFESFQQVTSGTIDPNIAKATAVKAAKRALLEV